MRLIGLHGFKGVGKDEVYRQINALLPGRTVRHGFADNLKVMAMLALGYGGSRERLLALADHLKDSGHVESWMDKLAYYPSHVDGRQYIINFGQNARDTFGEDFWVDQVLPEREVAWPDRFTRVWAPGGKLPALGCVPDVRMENEARRVRAHGGEVWHVIRPGIFSDGQVTEQVLPAELIDVTIVNDDDLTMLRRTVAAFLPEQNCDTVHYPSKED